QRNAIKGVIVRARGEQALLLAGAADRLAQFIIDARLPVKAASEGNTSQAKFFDESGFRACPAPAGIVLDADEFHHGLRRDAASSAGAGYEITEGRNAVVRAVLA